MGGGAFRAAGERSVDGALGGGFITALSPELGEVQVGFDETRLEPKRSLQRSFGIRQLAASELEGTPLDVGFGARRAHVEALLHLREGTVERGTAGRRQLRDTQTRERLACGDAQRANSVLEQRQEQRPPLLRREPERAEHGPVDHERLGTFERQAQRLQSFLAGVLPEAFERGGACDGGNGGLFDELSQRAGPIGSATTVLAERIDEMRSLV
jgi:hypothetical protein